MKKIKNPLYLVYGNPTQRIKIVLNSSKILPLVPYIPSKEILVGHLFLEQEFLNTIKDYAPQPFIVKIKEEQFSLIVNSIRGKISSYDYNYIPLFAAPNNQLPICLIKPE